MEQIEAIRILRLFVVTALALFGPLLLIVISVVALNADLYGRITETVAVDQFGGGDSSTPMVRIVLHRVIPDTNSVEASIILAVREDTPAVNRLQAGAPALVAEIRDGSSLEPVALNVQTALDSGSFQPGWSSAASRSPVFLLPAYTSPMPYPFDDIRVRPIPIVRQGTSGEPFRVEIQKAFPGRQLSVAVRGGLPEIELKRTPIEIAYVMMAALIFFVLSIAIALGLFSAPSGLSGVQELVAVAGYLVAAAGFRDLLGLSRLPGTSLFELLILGVPLVILAIGVAISGIRAQKAARTPAT